MLQQMYRPDFSRPGGNRDDEKEGKNQRWCFLYKKGILSLVLGGLIWSRPIGLAGKMGQISWHTMYEIQIHHHYLSLSLSNATALPVFVILSIGNTYVTVWYLMVYTLLKSMCTTFEGNRFVTATWPSKQSTSSQISLSFSFLFKGPKNKSKKKDQRY